MSPRLTVGSRYRHEADGYAEEAKLLGVDGMNTDFGDEVAVSDGTDVAVQVTNTRRAAPFQTTVTAEYLQRHFEEVAR